MDLSCKTATGKEYEIRFMGATTIGVTNILYIEFINYKLADIVSIFSNERETNTIYGFVEGELQKTYQGYTNLIEAIVLAESGNIRIALTTVMEVLGLE